MLLVQAPDGFVAHITREELAAELIQVMKT